MSFTLRFAKAPLDRRPGAPTAEAASEPSNAPAFGRGLLIGFCGAFFMFDWALLGGATTRSCFSALQHLLAGR
jgi:hypothetical protein